MGRYKFLVSSPNSSLLRTSCLNFIQPCFWGRFRSFSWLKSRHETNRHKQGQSVTKAAWKVMMHVLLWLFPVFSYHQSIHVLVIMDPHVFHSKLPFWACIIHGMHRLHHFQTSPCTSYFSSLEIPHEWVACMVILCSASFSHFTENAAKCTQGDT